MKKILVIIDPQNDFMDTERSALRVKGASADMARLSSLIEKGVNNPKDALTFDEIVVTLDSHASYGVERTTFWQNAAGLEVDPFTQVTPEIMKSGEVTPRDPSLYTETLEMLTQLQERRGVPMTIWPVHCVVGTWGHAIDETLAKALAQWEHETKRAVRYIFKGQSPMTEHFSAIGAEVQIPSDSRTHTNHELLAFLGQGQHDIWVAGEASSHCVRFTVEDIWNSMPKDKRNRIALLSDCMSAVPGFSADEIRFFDKANAYGCPVVKSTQV